MDWIGRAHEASGLEGRQDGVGEAHHHASIDLKAQGHCCQQVLSQVKELS